MTGWKLRSRTVLARSLLLISLVLSPGSCFSAGSPNIVVVMTDDQGYGDLGITGNPVIHTPHIDALAKESGWMERFYVSPVCSPTRASLMTGRYNYRTRVVDTFKGRSMMEPDELTIAEILRDSGYATGIFGKWHLGDNYPLRPQDQGFDEVLVHQGGGLAQPSEPIENDRRYTDPILLQNGQPVKKEGYCTDIYFDSALSFIDQCKQSGKPFFAYIAPNAPHGPYHDVPEELYRKYKAANLAPVLNGNSKTADTVARVYAMIENIDQNMGRLTEKLEEAGLAANTIVIFMVDNGPNTPRYTGPFRGMKTSVHEGGIRSPFLFRWPERVKPGTASKAIAAHIDVLPTLLEAAGVALPDGRAVDGRSFLPLLTGESDEGHSDRTLVIQTHRGDEPIPFHHAAVIRQRWKLVHPTGFGQEEMPAGVPFELYDIPADPGEKEDLAARHPGVVAELKAAYRAWLDDVSHTRPDNFAPPRIIAGSDRQRMTVLTPQDWRPESPGGWGENAAWLLTFTKDASYDIRLRWREPVAPGEVRVQIGGVEVSRELNEPADEIIFKNVTIPAGNAALKGFHTSASGERKDVYHVYLTRR